MEIPEKTELSWKNKNHQNPISPKEWSCQNSPPICRENCMPDSDAFKLLLLHPHFLCISISLLCPQFFFCTQEHLSVLWKGRIYPWQGLRSSFSQVLCAVHRCLVGWPGRAEHVDIWRIYWFVGQNKGNQQEGCNCFIKPHEQRSPHWSKNASELQLLNVTTLPTGTLFFNLLVLESALKSPNIPEPLSPSVTLCQVRD